MANECNIKLNYHKLQYKQNEVEFLGETYTKSGHKPSKDKVAAFTSMPSPTNRKQVKSFIGMMNYLAKTSPKLSEIAEPIQRACKGQGTIQLGSWTSGSLTSLKKEIASTPVLAYYNSKKQTTLKMDVSIKRLEACLLQDSKPVYFASKALTEAQKGYVVIELEALPVA